MEVTVRFPGAGRRMCLALAILCESMIVGHAAAQDGTSSWPPAPLAQSPQACSTDAAAVTSANQALLEYAGLSPAKQQGFTASALEIARVRRHALARLIDCDPATALRLSLSPWQRQGLPKAILDLLETRLHAIGDLVQTLSELAPGESQIHQLPGDRPVLSIGWTARIGHRTRRAFVYGVRLRHQTKFRTPIHGIAIGEAMAIDESPLYRYDPFETMQLGFQPGQIVATGGGAPILLQDDDAFQKLRASLIDQLFRFGPLLFDFHAWTRGPKRVLVIKADFDDRPGALYTDIQIEAALEETSRFFEENSQGLTSLTPHILPAILRLPLASTRYAAMGEYGGAVAIREHAFAEARAFDAAMGGSGAYDPFAYDRVLVVVPQVFAYPVASADLGGRTVVVTGTRLVLPALAHEFGHTYGFIHSAFWFVPFDADPIGPGTPLEYGDVWDMMGSPTLDRTDEDPRRRHFNAFFKMRAGWLPADAVADATAGGVFRLYRHDSADASGLRAIWIDGGPEKNYWLDIRRQFPWNTSMSTGVEVRRVLEDPAYVYGPVQLLDMDRLGSGSTSHSLVRFRSFEDAPSEITIRIANIGTDGIGHFADVVVTR
jgi:hypothetical protein